RRLLRSSSAANRELCAPFGSTSARRPGLTCPGKCRQPRRARLLPADLRGLALHSLERWRLQTLRRPFGEAKSDLGLHCCPRPYTSLELPCRGKRNSRPCTRPQSDRRASETLSSLRAWRLSQSCELRPPRQHGFSSWCSSPVFFRRARRKSSW